MLLAVALAAAGCRADLQVLVDVDPDGSGVVRVGVGVDEEAAAALPDLGAALWVDDLRAAGWRVQAPAPEVDGLVWVRASHRFSEVGEANVLLDEVSGPEGPFGGLTLRHDAAVLRSETSLRGTVDLGAGLEGFADQALRDALGADSPLAPGPLEQRLGRPLADVLTVEVVALLPGEVRSPGADEVGHAAVWRLRPGERASLVATAHRWHLAPVAWGVVAVAAAAGLVVLLVHRVRRPPVGVERMG